MKFIGKMLILLFPTLLGFSVKAQVDWYSSRNHCATQFEACDERGRNCRELSCTLSLSTSQKEPSKVALAEKSNDPRVLQSGEGSNSIPLLMPYSENCYQKYCVGSPIYWEDFYKRLYTGVIYGIYTNDNQSFSKILTVAFYREGKLLQKPVYKIYNEVTQRLSPRFGAFWVNLFSDRLLEEMNLELYFEKTRLAETLLVISPTLPPYKESYLVKASKALSELGEISDINELFLKNVFFEFLSSVSSPIVQQNVLPQYKEHLERENKKMGVNSYLNIAPDKALIYYTLQLLALTLDSIQPYVLSLDELNQLGKLKLGISRAAYAIEINSSQILDALSILPDLKEFLLTWSFIPRVDGFASLGLSLTAYLESYSI